MIKNQCILVIGEEVADILSPIEKGYDILNYNFAIEQVADESGKTTSRISNGGTVQVTLPQFPSNEIIEWGLTPGRYHDCAILVFDGENKLLDKTILQYATCVNFKIDYAQEEAKQVSTKIILHPKKLIVAKGIEFDN